MIFLKIWADFVFIFYLNSHDPGSQITKIELRGKGEIKHVRIHLILYLTTNTNSSKISSNAIKIGFTDCKQNGKYQNYSIYCF